jgi:hypothetical protein
MTRATGTVYRPKPLDIGPIRALIERKERNLKIHGMLMLLGGVPLSFVGPFVVAVFIWLVRLRGGADTSFWSTVGIVCLIGIPIVYLIASQVQGSILEGAADNFDTSSVGGFMAQRRAATPLLILEIANIGPRMVLYAVRRYRERATMGSLNLERAAQLVAALGQADEGIHPKALLASGETLAQLLAIVELLNFHDVVGMSKARDRIWLSSDIRKRFGLERH